MGARFTQIGPERINSGLSQPVAMLRQGVEELEGHLDLHFREAIDDLDELKIALLETANHHQFALTQHKHAPEPGVIIHADDFATDLAAELREITSALNIAIQDVKWSHPDITQAVLEDIAQAQQNTVSVHGDDARGDSEGSVKSARPRIKRLLRWLTRADAKENNSFAAKQKRQSQVQTSVLRERSAAEATRRAGGGTHTREGKIQRSRGAAPVSEESQRAERNAAAVARACAQVARLPRIEEHPKALRMLCVITATGDIFYVHPADLERARTYHQIDIPLSTPAGVRLHTLEGYKGPITSQLSIIEKAIKSIIVPAQEEDGRIVTPHRISQPSPTDRQRRGQSLSRRDDGRKGGQEQGGGISM